jgi:hypothetical protein
MNANKVIACIAALVAFVAYPAAHAQAFRAYVSSTGLDTNPCSLQQPCRLLPAALTAVADGGEIWMLDSANYNTGQVNITKSVTILAIPGAVGSVVATGGGDAININAAGAKVTLRNLAIVHLTSSNHGVNFAQGAQLGVSDCEIANIQGSGIYVSAPASKVSVRNVAIRGTGAGAIGVKAVGDTVASLDGVHVKGLQQGVYADSGARVTIGNSVLADNATGVIAIAAGGTTTRLVVAHSTISGNAEAIRGQTMSATDAVTITARSNSLAHSTLAAIRLLHTASSTLNIVSDGNTLLENNVGIEVLSGTPTIYTRDNNTFRFNTPDLSGGALTSFAAQ